MKKIFFLSFFLLLFTFSTAHAKENQKVDLSKLSGIPNATLLEDNLISSGTPSQKGLQQASEQGIRTIVDFRTPEEGTAEEAQKAKSLGLHYVNIPFKAGNFSAKEADQLAETLKTAAPGRVLLHCATGQRATAAWSLYRSRHQGVSPDQAFREAEQKGLKKPELKTKLQSLLQDPKENTAHS